MKLLKIFGVIINIIIMLLALLCDSSYLRCLMTLQIIINVYLFVKGNSNILTCGLIFFIFICLFHYGIFIDSNPSLFELGIKDIYNALRLSIACISAICVGYFFKQSTTNCMDVSHTVVAINELTMRKLRKFTWIMLAITIVPMVYMDIMEYVYTYSMGYGASYMVGQSNKLMSLLSRFTRPIILVLMISYSDDKKIAKKIFLTFAFYLFLKMFSGHRADSMLYIVTASFIYIRIFVNKIKYKHVFICLSLFVVFAVFLQIVSDMRINSTNVSMQTLAVSSTNIQEEGGFIKSFFYEYGATLVSVAYPMKYLVGGFNYGLSYIYGFFFILPSIPDDIFMFIKNSMTFTNALRGHEFIFLGGSCIGELYYNFGWFAPIFALIIGWFIRIIDVKLLYVNDRNLYSFLMYIVILPTLFLWVRGYFANMLFVGFWIPVIYKVLLKKIK